MVTLLGQRGQSITAVDGSKRGIGRRVVPRIAPVGMQHVIVIYCRFGARPLGPSRRASPSNGVGHLKNYRVVLPARLHGVYT